MIDCVLRILVGGVVILFVKGPELQWMLSVWGWGEGEEGSPRQKKSMLHQTVVYDDVLIYVVDSNSTPRVSIYIHFALGVGGWGPKSWRESY